MKVRMINVCIELKIMKKEKMSKSSKATIMFITYTYCTWMLSSDNCSGEIVGF
jgi:hypothetical protein